MLCTCGVVVVCECCACVVVVVVCECCACVVVVVVCVCGCVSSRGAVGPEHLSGPLEEEV